MPGKTRKYSGRRRVKRLVQLHGGVGGSQAVPRLFGTREDNLFMTFVHVGHGFRRTQGHCVYMPPLLCQAELRR